MANYDFSEYANGLRDMPMPEGPSYQELMARLKQQMADTVGINPSMYGAGAQNAHPDFRWERPQQHGEFNPGPRFMDDSMQPAKRVEPKKAERYGVCVSCAGDTWRPADQDMVICKRCGWELTGMDVMDITQAVARIPDRKARDLAKRMLFIAEGNRNRRDRQAFVQPGALEAAP